MPSFNPFARPDDMYTWSCSKSKLQRVTAWSILFVTVYLFMHVNLSEFIQSDVPSNTLTNEFGTVFERLEELENQ